MPLTKLVFRPGINRETTAYANEGGWYDCNLVRFRAGRPETIGGWTRYTRTPTLGTGRALMAWTTLDGAILTGLGTNQKYYIIRGSTLNDITPIREVTAAGAVTINLQAYRVVSGTTWTLSSVVGAGSGINGTHIGYVRIAD